MGCYNDMFFLYKNALLRSSYEKTLKKRLGISTDLGPKKLHYLKCSQGTSKEINLIIP